MCGNLYRLVADKTTAVAEEDRHWPEYILLAQSNALISLAHFKALILPAHSNVLILLAYTNALH